MACGETHGLSARKALLIHSLKSLKKKKTTHPTPLRALPPPLLEAPPRSADHLHLPDRERSKKRCETRGPREREQRRCARERERRLAQEEVEAEETASNEKETEKTGDPFRPYVTPHSSHTSHRNPFLFALLPKEGDRKKLDFFIGDVVNEIGSLHPEITASNFAKGKDNKSYWKGKQAKINSNGRLLKKTLN